ncbi:hypothetical protein [Streptomyces sp. NPDC046985]|uniref:hypothetical protein n=1 Tax=Streptomyces sp. NPDC046985 TaxID=3155377 RepID=UPI0033EFA14C
MPTLTLPGSTGARSWAAAALTASAAVTAVGATWLAAPAAMAQGEAGDIKIHRVGVSYGAAQDDPMVCRFYLDATGFGALRTIGYRVQAMPSPPAGAAVKGAVPLAAGTGHTGQLSLADGQYKLVLAVAGPPREKIFRVDCRDAGRQNGAQGPNGKAQGPNGKAQDPGRGQGGGPGAHRAQGGPLGGVYAGGGGLADAAQAFSAVAGAGAVALVMVSAVMYLRMIRRRSHGAA